ncbi:MAG: hypothetical protein D6694_10070, partial [Gammaproteobacteria bacterium]
MFPRIIKFLLVFNFIIFTLSGCGGDSNTYQTANDPYHNADGTPTVFARFDASTLPLPNDLTWAADNDPRVNLPLANDGSELDQLKQIINAQPNLLGLSPNMFLTLPVTGAVNSNTLNLVVFRTDDPNLPNFLGALAVNDLASAAGFLASMEIRTETDFIILDDFTSGVVKLLPKTPFTPGAAYAVVVKSGLLDGNGNLVASSFTMEALKSTAPFSSDSPLFKFETLRAALNDGATSLFSIIEAVTAVKTGAAWTRDDVLVTWTFHTADYTLSLTPTIAGAETVDYPGGATPFTQTTANLKVLSAGFTTNNIT